MIKSLRATLPQMSPETSSMRAADLSLRSRRVLGPVLAWLADGIAGQSANLREIVERWIKNVAKYYYHENKVLFLAFVR